MQFPEQEEEREREEGGTGFTYLDGDLVVGGGGGFLNPVVAGGDGVGPEGVRDAPDAAGVESEDEGVGGGDGDVDEGE